MHDNDSSEKLRGRERGRKRERRDSIPSTYIYEIPTQSPQ